MDRLLAALPDGTQLRFKAEDLRFLLEVYARCASHVATASERELSVSQVAATLGISRQAVLAAIRRKALPARRIGRNHVIARADLAAHYRPRQRNRTAPK